MDGILKDIPLEGKIASIGEDTVAGGSLIFPTRNLRITLYFKNEILRVRQDICFTRSLESGDILGSLINDFKDGKELRIKGKVSYFLVHPIANMRGPFFKKIGMPKEYEGFIKNVAHLAGSTDWKQISREDRDALDEFLNRCPLIFAERNNLQVLIDGKARYAIGTDKNHADADIFLQQEE